MFRLKKEKPSLWMVVAALFVVAIIVNFMVAVITGDATVVSWFADHKLIVIIIGAWALVKLIMSRKKA